MYILKAGHHVSCSFVCCVCDFDVCIWVFVWGGVLETTFLKAEHLVSCSFVCCVCDFDVCIWVFV